MRTVPAICSSRARCSAAFTTSVRCEDQQWSVQLEGIDADEAVSERRKLPRHEPCAQYEIGVLSARW